MANGWPARRAVEIAQQTGRHVVVEFQPLKVMIFHLAIKHQGLLVDWQQAAFMRGDAHAGDGVRVQRRVQIRPFPQQTRMDDQRAALDRFDIGIRDHVAVEIDFQQR